MPSHEHGGTHLSSRSTTSDRGAAVAPLAAGASGLVGLLIIQFSPAGPWLLFIAAALGLAVFVLVRGISRDNPWRIGAGLLAIGAAVALIIWVWGATSTLYTDDPIRACATLFEPSAIRPQLSFQRSVLPPALLCFTDEPATRTVLGTPLATVVGWSTGLAVIFAGFVVAGVLNGRQRKMSDYARR